MNIYTPAPRRGRGVYCFTSVRLSVLPSVQDIFHRIFLSNCWWQKSDIWSQASYRYTILWVAFLDRSDSYFLFADLVGFYTHWTYMHIFRHIFLSNYWWQTSDIWSQPSYRYPIWWEAFFDPSDSYFLFAEERGYHRWALAHSSSCFFCFQCHSYNVWVELLQHILSFQWPIRQCLGRSVFCHDKHNRWQDCFISGDSVQEYMW
jgi:hypothetical protein